MDSRMRSRLPSKSSAHWLSEHVETVLVSAIEWEAVLDGGQLGLLVQCGKMDNLHWQPHCEPELSLTERWVLGVMLLLMVVCGPEEALVYQKDPFLRFCLVRDSKAFLFFTLVRYYQGPNTVGINKRAGLYSPSASSCVALCKVTASALHMAARSSTRKRTSTANTRHHQRWLSLS